MSLIDQPSSNPPQTKWLVTGARGQLGADLVKFLIGTGAAVIDLGRADLDVTDATAVDRVIGEAAAGCEQLIVINAAAFTAVDAAEAHPDTAFAINAHGPGQLANACATHGARLIHVSTDYVFAGDATNPYEVTAEVKPLGVYGQSKAAGEAAVLQGCESSYVVRTSWLYGRQGKNFVKTIVRLSKEREFLSIVDDQYGTPTWTGNLAAGLVALGQSNAPFGIYHCTNSGSTTWCGLAKAVFEELGEDPARAQPITTSEYPLPAPRPAYSVLSNARWTEVGLPTLPPWRQALRSAFQESDFAN